MRFVASIVALAAAQSCLDAEDVVPIHKRRNLTYSKPGQDLALGYNGPIVDSAPWWASAQVIHGMAKILFTEHLGYTYENKYGVPSSVMFVLGPSGCKEMNKVNEACSSGVAGEDYDEWNPQIHYGLEGWGSAMGAFASIPPERRATMLTKHAYRGVEAIFIRDTVLTSAYDKDKLILNTYKGWNVTKFPQLLSHFPSLGDAIPILDAAEVMKRPLETTPSAVSHANYAVATGDAGAGACYDSAANVQSDDPAESCKGDWWISPTCRVDPLKCIPLITSGGWGEAEFRQWAAFYDMPLAITDTNWGSYLAGIRGGNVAFYWWYPDATFAAINPRQMAVPAWNINEYNDGIYKTSMPESDLTRFVWRYMDTDRTDYGRGKNIVYVLNRMAVYQADIDYFMAQFGLGRGGEDIACEFLQKNKNRWTAWIPNLNECIAGKGWDSDNEVCIDCPAGTVSEMSNDANNRICKPCDVGFYCAAKVTVQTPCDAGHYCPTTGMGKPTPCDIGREQPGLGHTECTECAIGYYAEKKGTANCSPCPVGHAGGNAGMQFCDRCLARFYQDEVGQPSCKACKPDFISPPGASVIDDCVCGQGTYFSDAVDMCVDCQHGTICLQGTHTPFIKEGFYAEEDNTAFEGAWVRKNTKEGLPDKNGDWIRTTEKSDLSGKKKDQATFFSSLLVWTCTYGVKACPGRNLVTKDGYKASKARLIDECNGGLSTNGCTKCDDGFFYNSEITGCSACTGGDNALYPLIYISGLIIMLILYKLTRYNASQKLTNMLMFSCSASLLVNFFQMMGVIGFYAVEFPNFIDGFFDFFKLFVFDLDVLRASCATGSDFKARFLTRNISPVIFIGSFLCLYPLSVVLSKIVPFVTELDKFNILNTSGLITNAGYIALCKISMQYYECKEQPSAPPTVAAYPYIDCNSDEHASMLGLAVIMTLLYGGGIYVLCLYLCWIAPIRMVESQEFRRKTRFLVGRWNPGRWYWGPVLQTRNLIVSLVAVAYPSDGIMQLVVTGAIVVIYTAAQATMEPWRDLFLNVTDTVLGLAITLTCMFGVMLVSEVGDAESRTMNASIYLTLIFLISFLSLFYALAKATMAFVNPNTSRAKDKQYTMQATKVLLLQTKRLYQLCMEGSTEDDISEAIGCYLTFAEQRSVFKLGKVLLHEMCGVTYKAGVDFKRLMINNVDSKAVEIESVGINIMEGLDDAPQGSAGKPDRVSVMSRMGGTYH